MQRSTLKFQKLDFASGFTVQLRALAGSLIQATDNYFISGGAAYHARASRAGVAMIAACTIALIGTPAFSGAFAGADEIGEVSAYSIIFSGTATGIRYTATTNGVVFTNGGTLPGSLPGTTASGGLYA